jgi:gamma-glutamylcyclotransferase (GGCT)/AIG2-like uncharacterized protein YtfP
MNYFAYGSTLNSKHMATLCPRAKRKCMAVLPNYKLIFTGWSRTWGGGIASVKPAGGQKVPGAVYEISEGCLRALDKYKGYPSSYNRRNIMVFTDLGDAIEAIIYIKLDQTKETQPSQKYLLAIKEGYKSWDII